MNLQDLGITPEELQERLVTKLAEDFLTTTYSDEYGDPVERPSSIKKQLDAQLKKTIDAKFEDLAQRLIAPNLEKLITELVIQRTNEFGQVKGEPQTFIEYLVDRANKYIEEPVDDKGRTQEEFKRDGNSYGWKAAGSRLIVQIDKYLSNAIKEAVIKLVQTQGKSFAEGIRRETLAAINQVTAKMTVAVTVPNRID